MTERHVLGLSGGRDSAALAVYMRQFHSEIDITYFFTDTGKELPEVHEFLGRLEGVLGKSILRLNPDRDFDFWLKRYNNFLPSAQTRWCTKQLKLKPFEAWVRPMLEAGEKVFSYVAIRADESHRDGYAPTSKNLIVRMPFKEHGIDKGEVLRILESSGVGLPRYYEWRSRSGCTFCFFQQKIEWVRLMEMHPEAFVEAKTYEKTALNSGARFTWSAGESLEELSRPERVAVIRADHERRVARQRAAAPANPLRSVQQPDLEEVYSNSGSCLVCHK